MTTLKTAINAEAAALDAQRKDLAKKNRPVLTKLEAIIQKGENAFFASAKAVVEIVDKELFRPLFDKKIPYFKARWEMTHQNLTRYENAGRVLLALEEGGFGDRLPKNEAQCRELYDQSKDNDGFNGAKAVTLWYAIFELDETPTAKLIAEKSRNLFPKPDATTAESTVETPKPPSTSKRTSAALNVASNQSEDRVVEHVCSAKIVVNLDSTVLRDCLEYEGRPCEQVGENQWKFEITAKDKSSLIHELASWSRVYDLAEVTIKFN